MTNSVLDVAAFILRSHGPMTAMKLQKLVYYAQAWCLVWHGRPLFLERIEAWVHGPVIPDLYQAHRGRFRVTFEDIPGDPFRLGDADRRVVRAVLRFYGGQSSEWLSDLTHREDPWRLARGGLSGDGRGHSEISQESMREYYSSI
jgi:uncharacterized phage-associated protein